MVSQRRHLTEPGIQRSRKNSICRRSDLKCAPVPFSNQGEVATHFIGSPHSMNYYSLKILFTFCAKVEVTGTSRIPLGSSTYEEAQILLLGSLEYLLFCLLPGHKGRGKLYYWGCC